jgi:tyrosyl-tRNA synthetase
MKPLSLEQVKRGTVEVISEKEMLAKLAKKKPLKIKVGFDPTSPDLHLGHTVLIQKMKQFQDAGHEVIFIIGDYTARIGDPSGRNEARPPLTEAQIGQNVLTYKEQVFKILDRKKTHVAYNSKWLGRMRGEDLIRLAAKKTVSRMLERDDFDKRYKNKTPIYIHEFLYPLLQGMDSVELEADIELGGTDQKFNLLVGRDLQRDQKQEPQVVITLPLLVGTDGVQKMSKTYGNAIGINEAPGEMFGKLMSITDTLMWSYFELLSDLSTGEIDQMKQAVEQGGLHPKKVKMRLAQEIVSRYHDKKAAVQAAEEFEKIFANKGKPTDIEEVQIKSDGKDVLVANLIADAGLAVSKSEARRLIKQKAVSINDKKFVDPQGSIKPQGSHLIQVGKRRFKQIKFS